MKRAFVARIFALLVCTMAPWAVSGYDFSRAESGSATDTRALAPEERHEFRATLRIGMWTLWHDRQITLASAGTATVRSCSRCPARPLTQSITIRAAANTLAIAGSPLIHSALLEFSGPITVTAHGEFETLHYSLTITARNGELVLVVTLPVETYVERVTASESGPADTLESLKALAMVVRTYALHVPHGHKDYDLCDSTHCQLLHWHGVPNRAAAAHAATLATAGETLWFRHQPALAYFNKDCGGHTSSPNEIWPAAPSVTYLPSRPDPYCVRTGGNDWASELSRQDIASALAVRGLVPPGLAASLRLPPRRHLAAYLLSVLITAKFPPKTSASP